MYDGARRACSVERARWGVERVVWGAERVGRGSVPTLASPCCDGVLHPFAELERPRGFRALILGEHLTPSPSTPNH